ncbi:MAG: 7-cyano-7-deazaguanine synthase [Planctomycetota bacterium]
MIDPPLTLDKDLPVDPPTSPLGLLLSGGLDSAILLAVLLEEGRTVFPIFIRGGLLWENEERRAVEQFWESQRERHGERLRPVVELQQPVRDLYGDHWSTTGQGSPGTESPDEAVFLPGRNALLLVKAILWCQLHQVPELALAPLASNPFGDASDAFFADFERAMTQAMMKPIRISRPFAQLKKPAVMKLGAHLPLELSFSCIAPRAGNHCGACNKCEERRVAFRAAGLEDRTVYAERRGVTG